MVCDAGTRFVSATLYPNLQPEETSSVDYKVSEWATPRNGNGPLAVFKSKRQALKFAEREQNWLEDLHIFECFYEPSSASGMWLKMYWKEGKPNIWWSYTTLSKLPKGTRLANRVMIWREVK